MMETSLCSSICTQEESVNLYFIEPEGDESPSDVLLCSQLACQDRFNTQWLSVGDCKQITPTKEDVFICDPFEGEAFHYLVSFPKSIVVGPRCILSCLHRLEPIPVLPSPLHNMAMSGIVITTTGFSKALKEEMQCLVQRMSGIFSNNYHQDVTHLVVNMVGSEKYKVAVEQGVPTMTQGWVKAVWQEVVTGDVSHHVSAKDNTFLKYLCPPLHGLVVCVSQTDDTTKMTLKKLIEENGGTYTTKLVMNETSVLVVPCPEGKKYQFAIKWNIPCLFPDWIHNSVQQGHALDKEEFEVHPRMSSTFTNTSQSNGMLPDLSLCSTIMNESDTQSINSVDETANFKERLTKGREVSENTQDVEALERLDLQEAMKADTFLKGYRLFLAGFSSNHLEKLRRVLGAVGASRLNQLTEAVTHVVLAAPREEYLRIMQGWSTKPHVVSVRWITESIRLKHPAEESQFAFQVEANRDHHQNSSTDAQSSSVDATAMDKDETHVDERLLEDHFVQPRRRRESSVKDSEQDVSLLLESQGSDFLGIFHGKGFIVCGHSQETKEVWEDLIKLHGGHTGQMGSSGPIHYLVITDDLQCSSCTGQLVSRAFLEDCIESKRLLAVEYYHLPLLLPGNHFPLENCCITISTYARYERYFLENMATLLGARNQEKFSKSNRADKNILANTHLLCPTPTGAKYSAAKKWGIPVMTCDWLIECARSNQKVAENTYLVESSSSATLHLPRKAIVREMLDSVIGARQNKEDLEEEEMVPPTPTARKTKSLLSLNMLDSTMVIPSTNEFTSTEGFVPPDEQDVKEMFAFIDALPPLTPDKPFDREAIIRQYPTPGTTQYYQAKLDAELDAMSTPETPYGRFLYDDPPPRVRKCFKKLIDSLPDPPTPLLPSPPTKSPTKEIMKDFLEALEVDLDEYRKKYQREWEEMQGKAVEPLATPITWEEPQEEHQDKPHFQEDVQDDTLYFSDSVEKEPDYNNLSNDDGNNENIPSALHEDNLHPLPPKEEDKEKVTITTTTTSTGDPQQQVFLLVGMSAEDVEEYAEVIVHLGGEVSYSQTLDAQVTHLVAKLLSRSERTLMSIVSGRWVLTPSYLDHCLKAGHFVEEEPYAWGNPSGRLQPQLEPGSTQAKLAVAAWRWKCAMNGWGGGGEGQKQQPFQDMTALIHTKKERVKSFTRLIKAGGGQVVSARPPYSDVEGVTHFFVEMEKTHEKIDLGRFCSRGIPCLQLSFINSSIIEDVTEISDFYIPEYKEILINMSSCTPSPIKRVHRI